MADIFKPIPLPQEDDDKSPKKYKPCSQVVIRGRAGIGKTTLCRYIAYRWAKDDNEKNKLWPDKFDIVIWLTLRNLNNDKYKEEANLATILEKELFSRVEKPTELTGQGVVNFIAKHPNKVLYLLDGWDEFGDHCSHCHKAIQEVLDNSQQHVIVTSRPFADINSFVDKNLENVGFTDDNIKAYAKNFFKDKPDNITSFLTFLKQNAGVYGLAHVPVNLELLCSVWKTKATQLSKKSPITLSALYQELVDALWERYNIRQTALADGDDDTQEQAEECLQKLAFHGMQKSRIVFPHDDVANAMVRIYQSTPRGVNRNFYRNIKPLVAAGWLHSSDSTIHKKRTTYHFLHLTLQEFMVAEYVAAHLDERDVQTCWKQHKYDPRWQVVWWFVAGLLKDNPTNCKQFFHLLQQPPRDLIGFQEQLLFMHCLQESELQCSTTIQNEFISELGQWLSVCFSKETPFVGKKGYQQTLFEHLQMCPAVVAHDGLQSTWEEQLLTDVVVYTDIVFLLSSLNTLPNKFQSNIITALIYRLNISDQFVKYNKYYVISILVRLTVNNKEFLKPVITALTNVLNNDPNDVKGWAANALGKLTVNKKEHREPIITTLTNALNNGSNDIQGPAAYALVRLTVNNKEFLKPVITALTNVFNNGSYNAQKCAAHALRELTVNDDPAHLSLVISAFTNALSNCHYNLKERVARALIHLTDSDPVHLIPVITALTNALNNNHDDVKGWAAYALGQLTVNYSTCLTPVIIALTNALNNGSNSVKGWAAYALGRLTINDPAHLSPIISALTSALNIGCDHVKERAARALGQLTINDDSSHLPSMMTALTNALNNGRNSVKYRAATALVQLTVNDPTHLSLPIITVLTNALNNGHDDVKWRAASALVQLTVNDPAYLPPVITVLNSTLNNSHDDVKERAAYALGQLTINNKELLKPAITALTNALKNGCNSSVKGRAAYALGQLTVNDLVLLSPHIPALINYTLNNDRYDVVKERASRTLVQLFVNFSALLEPVIKVLTNALLSGRFYDFKEWAAETLVKLTVNNPAYLSPVISALTNALNNDHHDAQWLAADALVELTVNNKAHREPVISALTNALNNGSKHVKEVAAYALRKQATLNNKELLKLDISALTNELNNGTDDITPWAAETLVKLTVNDPAHLSPVISALTNALLNNGSYYVQKNAASALKKIHGGADIITSILVDRLRTDLAKQLDANILTLDMSASICSLLTQHKDVFWTQLSKKHITRLLETTPLRCIAKHTCQTPHLLHILLLVARALQTTTAIALQEDGTLWFYDNNVWLKAEQQLTSSEKRSNNITQIVSQSMTQFRDILLQFERPETQLNKPILYQVKAMYHYAGKNPGHLTFDKNTTLDVLEEIDDRHLRCAYNNKEGIVPRVFVERINELKVLYQVKGLYDYSGKEDEHLAFDEDVILDVIKEVDAKLLRCKYNDEEGFVPRALVQRIPPSPGTYAEKTEQLPELTEEQLMLTAN